MLLRIKTSSWSKKTSYCINYLCERHVCGNSCSLFCQKSLFFLREHNLFKLELRGGKTTFFFLHDMLFCGFSVEHIIVPHFQHTSRAILTGIFAVNLNLCYIFSKIFESDQNNTDMRVLTCSDLLGSTESNVASSMAKVQGSSLVMSSSSIASLTKSSNKKNMHVN